MHKFTAVLILVCLSFTAAGETADSAYINGRIYTVDANHRWVEAVAIRDGRFMAAGSNTEIRRLISGATKVTDLGGRMVLPGIHDMHMHPVAGALNRLFACNFSNSLSLEEISARIRQCAEAQPPGSWIRGGAYGANLLQSKPAPHKSMLDAAAPEHPVYLRSSGGHSGWANSLALKLAGIDRETPDPADGEIVRDPLTGEATGLLLENANRLMAKMLPEYTVEQYRQAVRWSAETFNQYGITTIKDAATSPEVASAYHAVDEAGELTLRVGLSLLWPTHMAAAGTLPIYIQERDQYRGEHVYPDSIKIFVDGSAGARKAAYLEPYLPDGRHDDDYRGEFMIPPEQLNQDLILADRLGLTVKMHCGGDAAVRVALDAIQAAREENGVSGLRHEVAHPNLMAASDISRYRKLDAIAELSPMYWYPSRIVQVLTGTLGEERVRRIWQMKSLVDAGALAVYGSDWPAVVPNANPWRGLEAMVTRRDPEGNASGAFNPSEALDLATAVEIFTRNGAYALNLAESTGTIEVGKLADMIVLDRNLFDINANEISETVVLLTLLSGEIVYTNGEL